MERPYWVSLTSGYDRNEVLTDLMRQYGDDVWNFAFFLTRRFDAADDICQEVFIMAFKGLYSFRGESSVKSWLLTIARNKSLNYLKSAFIRKVTLLDKVIPRERASPSAEAVMFDRLESAELWDHVMQLPRKLKEVIILDYHYGMAIKEIAAMLQLSEGTVKSRMFRAKQRMSELLKEEREYGI
ncbi:hypothetical protein SD71_20855 [Cohnella kolymensis]|uniref:RNA polymerase sigma-70 factor n=1 Tax=Cohnella kolymensis TaxID=1590652 RepID=A0ABR5A0J0_9BACL|nr:sigma-70 family RNA polymerase sigma factor [Cohnella kolymensis]KIL34143.1 hypothetical protein SD71_20855 [Cohnella kolymensis]